MFYIFAFTPNIKQSESQIQEIKKIKKNGNCGQKVSKVTEIIKQSFDYYLFISFLSSVIFGHFWPRLAK